MASERYDDRADDEFQRHQEALADEEYWRQRDAEEHERAIDDHMRDNER